jgi:hypothetical protein
MDTGDSAPVARLASATIAVILIVGASVGLTVILGGGG